MKIKKVLGFMFFTSFFAGCSLMPKDLNKEIAVTLPEIDKNKIIKIKYLGAGGVIISRGDDSIMSAPFFSNFTIPELAFPIKSNIKTVDKYYKELKNDNISGIIVGHSHYDHLIDLPYIHSKYHSECKIYGSTTTKNLLLSSRKYKVSENEIVDVTDKMAEKDRVGEWIWVKEDKIRIMAVKSSHSPHIAGVKFYGGELKKVMEREPKLASDWVEGQTIAYIIDFMEKDKPVYRVYYQDAASSYPYGIFPKIDDKKVDSAILCVGGYSEAENYPEYIVKEIKPESVMMIHWEDFFLPYGTNFMEIINIKEPIGKSTVKFRERVESIDKDIKTVIPTLGYSYLFMVRE